MHGDRVASDWSPSSGSNRSEDRKSTRLNSSHSQISYAVLCLKKKKQPTNLPQTPLAESRYPVPSPNDRTAHALRSDIRRLVADCRGHPCYPHEVEPVQ